MQVFSDALCALGEGPLWHPERKQLFWFDILGKRMFSKGDSGGGGWQFEEQYSAAGWVDRNTLLMASATGFWRFDIATAKQEHIADLEADNPVTRSNDGRADPQGGFWIGTMGLQAEAYAGAIYRYYRGEVRQLFDRITISNSICFAPDGRNAYFTDTHSRRIQKVALDAEGWPDGDPEVFLDLRTEELNPDGSVVDANGNLWNAQWGASRVACYSPQGQFLRAIDVPASQATCPAFGGSDLSTMFVTSAADGVHEDAAGMTFFARMDVKGQAEHRVIL